MSYTALEQTTAGRDQRFLTTVFDDENDLQASFAVYPATRDGRALALVVREFPWEREPRVLEGPLSEDAVIETLATVIAETSGRDIDDVRAFAVYLAREPLIAIRRSPVHVESLLALIDRLRDQGTYGTALVIGALAYYTDDPLLDPVLRVVMSAARRMGEAIDNLDAFMRPRLAAGLDVPMLPRARADDVRALLERFEVGCPFAVAVYVAPYGRSGPGLATSAAGSHQPPERTRVSRY